MKLVLLDGEGEKRYNSGMEKEMKEVKSEKHGESEGRKEHKNHKAKKMSKTKIIVLSVIGVILVVVMGVALRYLLAYNGFLDKITNREPEMKYYSVIVMDESDLHEVKELVNKSVGFLKTDPKAANAEQKLAEDVKKESGTDNGIKADYYEDVDVLVDALVGDVTEAIVLESDRLEMLSEEKEDISKKTRVIYTFGIELSSENMEIADKKITAEPFVLYISGSDSREGVKATARSDVNIVAVVNPKESKILLVSIPRDTYVQLHDTVGLKDKLTHAGVYGIEMSKTTIEDFLGIDIDYTLKVSFDTVVKVVDQLDGIDITSDIAMNLKADNGKKCDFVEGKQHVDGDCALRFARERKSYETGDRHRGENQQQVITSIIGKLGSSKNYVLKIPAILDIAADSFETTISRDNVADFIRMQLLNGIDWKVKSISVDGTGTYEPTYSMGANLPLYVMIPSDESVKKAVDEINEYLKVTETENE